MQHFCKLEVTVPVGVGFGLAFGFILGSYFNDTGLGFLTVTGIYLLVMILCVLFRKKLKLFLTNIAIENAMEAMSNHDDDEEDEQDED